MRFNILLATLLTLPAFSQDTLLLTGSYDSPRGTGISVFRFRNGQPVLLDNTPSAQASYLTLSNNRNFVYAVNERGDSTGRAGGVSTFSLNRQTGQLAWLGEVSAEGNYPCHITLDRTGRWLVVSNYGTGNFALYAIGPDGRPSPARQIIRHQGRGPDSIRQKSPHVHSAFFSPDNRSLYVCDLGTDQVYHYRFDAAAGQVDSTPLQTIPCQGGGPRHLEQSADGRFLYVLMELTGEVMVLEKRADGKWLERQRISTLMAGEKGNAGSAAIHRSADGKHLYASNRGRFHDLVHFSIHPRTGLLKVAGHYPSGGQRPRDFSLDPSGRYLLVANQESDNIVIYGRSKKSGRLSLTGNPVTTGKPVCLQWLTF